MCFFNAAHNEFITQTPEPERIPNGAGPADAADMYLPVSTTLIMAYHEA